MAGDFERIFERLDSLQGQISMLVGEQKRDMAILSGKIDSQAAVLSERCTTRWEAIKAIGEKQDDMGTDLGVLKQDKAKIVGAAAVLGCLCGAVGSVIIKLWPTTKGM